MKNMSTIGKMIKFHRERCGLKQSELAASVGRGVSVISNWENGTNSPSADMIELLCSMLKCDPNSLFGWGERGLPQNEILLLEYFRRLNQDGQDSLCNTASGLTTVEEYKKRYIDESMEEDA
ncbi:MAG: helix-turn-helix domain-containing protein [Clostridiales bacterium]|nr:helix-turn-helix domain-containing protein [Clostridiales bacterium]